MRRLGFSLAFFEDDYGVYYNCSSVSRTAAKYVSPLSHGVSCPARKGEYRRGDWSSDESCVGQLSEKARSSVRFEMRVRSIVTRVRSPSVTWLSTCRAHHIGLHETNVVEVSAFLFEYGHLQHRCHFLTDNYETATACYTTVVIFDRSRYCVVKTSFFSSGCIWGGPLRLRKNDFKQSFFRTLFSNDFHLLG